MARIELKDLAHCYHPDPAGEEDYALKKMNHVWEDGKAYALLGPSGCGKTTLLNIISGLLQPSEGSIRFGERDVTALPPQERNIAQVFQFPVIYDTMSVYENLAFPLRNRKVPEAEVRERVLEVAEMLELQGDLKKRAANLGADAKQKISLGRGLVRSDVAAILFDEPLTVIDPHLKLQLRRKLKQIHARFKLTLVYVTHDQLEALTFADRVVVMNEGRILQIGTPQELFETPRHTFVGYFIGSPGMNFLDCRVADGVAVCGDLQVALAPTAKSLRGEFQLGIRPEFLRLSGERTLGAHPCAVREIEDLGSSRVVTVESYGQIIKVRLNEEQTVPAGEGFLDFPPEWIRLYADGRLVETGCAAAGETEVTA